MVDGFSFSSLQEYFSSAYFRTGGKRCGTDQVNAAASRMMAPAGAPSDCSLASTTILGEYYPPDYYVIPVVFHVMYKADGTGNISDTLIESQIDILNEDFGALAGTPGAAGFDSHIRFELADITRTQNDSWFNDSGVETEYKTALGRDQNRYLNVYVNSADGYLGYAYFPQGSAGTVLDGVVVMYAAVGRNSGYDPYDQGRTLTHETGHYLGLYHTFQGGCVNGYTVGDRIADTNPEQTEHFGCSPSASCGVADPIDNYLDYTDDTCMERFTPEQANRMICALLNYRSGLYRIEVPGLLGDLDEDGAVRASDLAILLNSLAGHLASGAAPFTATYHTADIDGDRTVDSLDLVAMADYLDGSSSQLRQ